MIVLNACAPSAIQMASNSSTAIRVSIEESQEKHSETSNTIRKKPTTSEKEALIESQRKRDNAMGRAN